MEVDLTITELRKRATNVGHENSVPPERSSRAEHHALIFFLDFYV
jgi:hypothetical protein